jgi:uncharacterized membrane protein
VDPIVLALIACSAVLHAAWNILLKTGGDPLRTATVGMIASSAVLVPAAIAGWWALGQPAVPQQALRLGVLSGAVEVAYFIFLAQAYRRGQLSVVAPIARGSAPLLVVAAGVLVLGERLAPVGWLGVALLIAGLLTVQRPWRFVVGEHAASRGAAGFALLTGVTIAVYSSIDRVGVQQTPPWLYAAILWPVCAAGLALVDLARQHAPAAVGLAPTSISLGRSVVGGLLTLGAYLLLLAALSRAELVIVGPLRESAMLLTSLWGIVRLREAVSQREVGLRLGGSVIVLAGVLTLAVAG